MTTIANGHEDVPIIDDAPPFELGWNVQPLADMLGLSIRDLQFKARLWPNSLRPILEDKARKTYFITLRRLAAGLGVDICDLFTIDHQERGLPLRAAIAALKRPDNQFNVAHNAAIDEVLALIAARWPNEINVDWYQRAEAEPHVA